MFDKFLINVLNKIYTWPYYIYLINMFLQRESTLCEPESSHEPNLCLLLLQTNTLLWILAPTWPSNPHHQGTPGAKKLQFNKKTNGRIFNCEFTTPALLQHFFLKIRGIIKPAHFLCYFITPGWQRTFLGCPESLPCKLGWFLHVPLWQWDGLAVKNSNQTSPPQDAKCTFLSQNTPSDVGGYFPSEASHVLLCLLFHILTHTLVSHQLCDSTKMPMWQQTPAKNQLWMCNNFSSVWMCINFRSTKTLSEEHSHLSFHLEHSHHTSCTSLNLVWSFTPPNTTRCLVKHTMSLKKKY